MRPYDTSPWVSHSYGKLPEKNIRILAVWEAGLRMLTAKRPVRAPEGVNGLKIRIPQTQLYIWLRSTLEANPRVMPLGEVYISLPQGVVDAQENPIPTIHLNKF